MTTTRARAYRTTARRWLAAFGAGGAAYLLLQLLTPAVADLLSGPFIAVLSASSGGFLYWTGRRHEIERTNP